MKRITSIILTICLVVSSVLTSAPIVHAETISGTDQGFACVITDGEACVTGMTSTVGQSVVIPETLCGYPVTGIGSRAFWQCENLTSVTIPKGVEYIGSEAFGYTSLKDVTLPDGVISIGYGAFWCCDDLRTISIPNSVKYIGSFAFECCDELTGLTIPNSVEEIGSMILEGCYGIKYISIPFLGFEKDDAQTAKIGYLFSPIEDFEAVPGGLKRVELTNTEYVSDFAFAGCHYIQEIILPDGVKYIGEGAFSSCVAMETLVLPQSITTIGIEAFKLCNFESINIPSNVKKIADKAFYRCDELLGFYWCGTEDEWYSLDIGVDNESLTTAKRYNHSWGAWQYGDEGEFRTCIFCDINEADVPINNHVYSSDCDKFCDECGTERVAPSEIHSYKPFDTPSTCTEKGYITYICELCQDSYKEYKPATGHFFTNGVCTVCGVVEDVSYLENFEYTISNKQVTITNCDEAITGDITIPSEIDGYPVVKISAWAFASCENVNSFVVPDSVTEIGEGAFAGCSSLMRITLPFVGGTKEKNQYFAYLFYGDTYEDGWRVPASLKTVILSDACTSIAPNAFYECIYLEEIVLGEGITSVGQHSFYGCTGLTRLTYKANDCKFDTGIGNAPFAGCSNINTIIIADNVEKIPNVAFWGCSGLKEIYIGSKVSEIGSQAFYGCNKIEDVHVQDIAQWCSIKFDDTPMVAANNLYLNGELITEVNIPNGVTKIGERAFSSTNITKITIPDSVTIIGTGAFWGATKILSIVIPDNVTSIGGYAFYGCSSLSSVFFGENVSEIGTSAFKGCDGIYDVHIENISTWATINFDYAVSSPLYYADKVFFDGELLEELIIPEGVETIGDGAFTYCTTIKSVALSEGTTNIGGHAFSYCQNLSNVSLPKSITKIGSYAFEGCSKLSTVWYTGSEKGRDNIEFGWEIDTRDILTADWIYNTHGINEHIYTDGYDEYCDICNWHRKIIYYTITYDANGGSNAPKSQTKSHGTNVALSNIEPIRDGYTFIGWSTSTDGDVEYQSGSTYSNNKSIKLYAQWKPDEYIITFDANGGVNVPTSQKKEHNIELVLSTDEPVREGYTFIGWSTSTNGDVEYQSGDTYSNNESVKLYAQWKIEEYTLTYDANGGSNAPASQKKTYNITLVLSDLEPVREGYTFIGWSTTVNGNIEYYPGDEYTANADITLYAIWHHHVYDNACDTDCNDCGDFREVVHSYGDWITTKEATCAEAGSKYKACAICGDIVTEDISKTNDHSYALSVTQPTCTEKGYTTHTCGICGDNYIDTYVNANGHKYDNDCDADCNVCGENRGITHTYGKWLKVDDETHSRTCICGDTETNVHSWSEGTITIPATHTSFGERTYTCKECSAVKIEQIAKTTEHSYSEWIKVDDETHNRSCICGDMESNVHNWDDGIITIQPTDTTYGEKTYTCSECSATKTEQLDMVSEIASGTCGKNLTWVLYSNGNLVVEGTGDMYDYKYYNNKCTSPWNSWKSDIKTVIIKDGVTSVGEYAFYWYYESLEKVEIAGTVSDIGQYSFYRCYSLTDLVLAEGVTTIGQGAFQQCDFATLTIPNSVTTIYSSAFNYCDELTDIDLGRNITQIYSSAFNLCPIKNVWCSGSYDDYSECRAFGIGDLSKATWHYDNCFGVYQEKSHTYSEWTNHNEVQHKKSCECIDVVYADHNWDDGIVTKEPTHKTTGIMTHTCNICNGEKTTIIAEQPHEFSEWLCISETEHSRTCMCGEVETSHHNWDDGIITKQPTQTDCGEYTFTCGDCLSTKKELIYPYIVAYDANGGITVPTAQIKIPGVDLMLSDIMPVRDGYLFKGWTANTTGEIYKSLSVSNLEGLHYAVGPYEEYNVSCPGAKSISLTFDERTEFDGDYLYLYDCNDNLFARYTRKQLSGITVIVPGDSITLKRQTEYYTDWGFAVTSAIAEFEIYSAGGSYSIDESVTLYAVWEELNKYSVIYDANGGTNAPDSQFKIQGTDLILTDLTPVREGYLFQYWSIVPDGTAQKTLSVVGMESEHNYTNNTNAEWTISSPGAKSIKLTFDSRTKFESGYDFLSVYDSSGTCISKYSGNELAGQTIEIEGEFVKLLLTSDYSNNYWGFKITSAEAYYDVYNSGDSYDEDENVTLYAIWKVCSHQWDSGTVTLEPTCKIEGIKTFICNDCGEEKIEEVPTNEHNEVPIPEITPTFDNCGQVGGTKCSNCGITLTEPTTLKPTGPLVTAILSSNSTLTVSGGLSDNKAAEGATFVAVYDSFKRMIALYDISDKDQSNFTIPLVNCGDAHTVKIMRWQIGNLRPLHNAVEVNVIKK